MWGGDTRGISDKKTECKSLALTTEEDRQFMAFFLDIVAGSPLDYG